MIRVFSERNDSAPDEACEPNATSEATADDRLTQVFELLFGTNLREHSVRIERMESETTERLQCIEREALHHADVLEQIVEKTHAALEREQGEYRRRKNVESELRETIAQVRAGLNSAIDELHERVSEMQRGVRQQLEELRETEAQHRQQMLDDVGQDLAQLKAGALDRTTLGTLFGTLARELGSATAEHE